MKYTQHGNIGTWHWKHATGISLDKSSITLTTVGQKEQLTATVVPPDASDKVTWSSSNTSIATVSQTGLVTCVTPGECTITATVNGHSATCGVTAQVMPTSGLLGYRKLEEDYKDYSGNGYNGTGNGTLSFATIGGYTGLNCGNSAGWVTTSLSYNALPVTMCIRAYGLSTNDWRCMISNHGTGSDNTLNYEIRTAGSEVSVSNGTSSDVRVSSTYTNAWHLWVVVITSSDTKVYKDGTLIGTGGAGSVGSNIGNWQIANRLSWGSNYHRRHGYLRQAALYNRALSDSEVLDYYNGTK